MSFSERGLFSPEELERYSKLSTKTLPTVNEALLFVLSKTSCTADTRMSHTQAVRSLASEVQDIWFKADCCPHKTEAIVYRFDNKVWKNYVQFMKADSKVRSH